MNYVRSGLHYFLNLNDSARSYSTRMQVKLQADEHCGPLWLCSQLGEESHRDLDSPRALRSRHFA